jgi:hypothetical protein
LGGGAGGGANCGKVFFSSTKERVLSEPLKIVFRVETFGQNASAQDALHFHFVTIISKQGDRIGRIFAFLGVCLGAFGSFLKVPKFLGFFKML